MPLKDNYQPGDLFGHADLNAMAGQVNSLADAALKQYRVNDYGADPTGAAPSDAALEAARAAMGTEPGIIAFGVGTYLIEEAGLNAENNTSLGLRQGVRGQGSGATRIIYNGGNACFEFRNLDWEFNTASEPSGGIHGMWIYGWENTNTDTYGIRYGDIGRMRVSDVHIAGFNQGGCVGLFGDNRVAWAERGDIECSVEQCTTAFLFQGCMPNSLQSYGSSFDYSKYRLTFVVIANQDAFVLRSLPGGMNTNMNGVDLALTGNCNNAPPGGTNTGTLFKVGRDNEDGASLSGELHVNVETSGYVDGVTHFDFSMGDGPFWEVQSTVSAFGSINLIPFSGTNFRAGTATPRTFAFAGLLKKSPAFGSTTSSQAFQPLQLLSQARGEYWIAPTNAVQMVYLVEATVGTFRLNYDGDLTDPIPYDASVAAVQAALDEIPGLAGNVTVVSAQPRFVNGYYNDETAYGITFGEALAETDVPTFTVDDSVLTGTAEVVVRKPGSTIKTLTARIESGNIIKIEETPGVYRLGLDIGNLTDQVGVDRDSPFGLTAVDIWIKQPTTGGNVVLEGPWFRPNAQAGSTYTFQWFDGIEPVFSTEPDKFDVIRLSTYNFNVWVGQHITRRQGVTSIDGASGAVTGLVTLTGTQTLTNKTLTSPTITNPTGNIVTSIDGASGAVTGVATTTGTQTLTNKTISGASNTITNLPASATPDAARLVCKTATGGSGAENGANTWAKLVTIAPVVNGSCALLLGITTGTSFQPQAAILQVWAYAAGSPSAPMVAVQLIGMPNSGYAFYADGFKLVNNGYGQPVELWIKKSDQYSHFSVTEISRSVDGAGTVTYNNGAAWQSAEPTGSAVNVRSAGVTVSGVPVVTTTATQTLTGKTLTAPVLSGTVTGTYTLGGTPTFPSTVVSTTGAQAVTNKTLDATNTSTKFISRSVATVTAPTALGSTAATDYVTFADMRRTVALLHCEGSDGSTSVVDSSNLGAGWTCAGNAQLDTAQYKFGSSSLLFDGTGDYITPTADAENFAFAGDFTWEMWIRPSAVNTRMLIDFRSGSSNSAFGCLYITTTIRYNTFGVDRIVGPTLSADTWYHIAVCRSGTSTRLFVDGTQAGSTYTDSTAYAASSPKIGIEYTGSAAPYSGHMDEISIVNGLAKYTANFTPPTTPLDNVTEDVSTAPSTVALLHCDGANASTVVSDSGVLLSNWTAAGNAQISTAQSKFGGSSLYFDGTGDYITPSADSGNLAFGTGDFTIEMWVRPTVLDGVNVLVFYESRSAAVSTGPYGTLYIRTDFKVVYYADGTERLVSSTTLSVNTWYHIALCRSGSSTKIYINGVSEGGTYTDTVNYAVGADRPVIGVARNLNLGLIGYMDEIRISKGVARYTSNFTPPTAPHPDPPAIKLPTAVANSNRYTVCCVGPQSVLLSNGQGQTINGGTTAVIEQDESLDSVSTGAVWRLV